jgi:hypothetical protein
MALIYCTNCHGSFFRPCPKCHPDLSDFVCDRCGQSSWAEGRGPPTSWRNVFTSALGAVFGGCLAGPPGALVGGLLGFFAGSAPGFFRGQK